ncbi:amine sulfotransferase-like [Amblyomma americanum]
MNEESLVEVDGLLVNDFLRAENVRAAMQYQPREDDVFIATYPKCGTTWTQYIVCNIFTGGNAPNNVTDFLLQAPYFDFMGADAATKMPRPGALMTHLPFSMHRHSNKAKYIYVARNPYDCAVSYYHYLLGHTPKTCTDVSFETFVKAFVNGRVPYGDFFDHLVPWYERRQDSNILFFTYEDLKKDTRAWVLKIADFIDKEKYGDALRNDEKLFQRILDACSLGNMREVFNCGCSTFVSSLLGLPEEKRLPSMEIYRTNGLSKKESHEGSGRVRKGKIGDWKNHFTTSELRDEMKSWIENKTKNTDVMRLWEDLDLP